MPKLSAFEPLCHRHSVCSVSRCGSPLVFETGVASLTLWQPSSLLSPPPARRHRRSISGTVLGNNLAITFHATDPFVINYRTLPFVFSAAAPVPMRMVIRTWGGRLTLNDHGTRIHPPTVSGLGFNVTYTCAAFSRFLTELAASGLLHAGPL